MELYNNKDLVLLAERIDNMEKQVTEKKYKILKPTKVERMEAINMVLDYLKEKRRKIYGGYAQNILVKNKNPKDAFYEDDVIPDVDFYSPDPIIDLKNIANILHDKGFPYVLAQEALHKETYKVKADYMDVCDITYVPRNIYNRIPYIELNGFIYAHPRFIMLDMYRMFSEPMFSLFRWKKTFPRLFLLQKHYPIPKPNQQLTQLHPKGDQMVLRTVLNYLKNKESIILVGNYAYNLFLEESGITKDNRLGRNYKTISVPHYEFISTDYKNDAKDLIKELKDNHKSANVTVVEHYPFWHYHYYSAYIKVDDKIVAYVIDYHDQCIPIKKIKPPKVYNNGKGVKGGRGGNGGKGVNENDESSVQIGSYGVCFLYVLVSALKGRVNKDKKVETFYNTMRSKLIEIKNYYLKKNGKNMFDDTLFQEFLVDCVGKTEDPQRKANLERREKRKARKMIVFRYDPETQYEKKPESNYRFSNSSGNPISNIKNLKVS